MAKRFLIQKLCCLSMMVIVCLGVTSCASVAPQQGSAAPAPEKTVLRVIPGINPDAGTKEFWNAVKEEYEARYPDVTVELNVQPNWDAVWTAVRGAIASGEPPDVFMTQENGPGMFWREGALLPLDDLAETGGDFNLSDFPQFQLDYEYKYDNHLIAVPIYTAPMFWMYNKEAFQKTGIEVPKTFDDILTACKKFQETGMEHPFHIGAPGGWAGHWMIWSFGAQGVTDQEGKVAQANTPELEAAVAWYWKFVNIDKCIDPAIIEGGGAFDDQAEAAKGSLVLWEAGPWSLAGYMQDERLKDVIGIAPRAAGPAGAIQTVGGSALMISAQTKHPQEAWNFIKVASDPTLLAEKWVIPYYDTVSNIKALKDPMVAEKAPIMTEVIAVMEAPSQVVWTVPWYFDVVGVWDSWMNKMLKAGSWEEAKAMLPQAQEEMQAAIDAGIAKFGEKK
jgi:ABC-type glycerol-3-phosphate transport system substrate-binding protein